MTAPTTTALSPEELARTADLRASLDRAYAIASPTGAANHLAAWANNHGKALLDLAEAQAAEIERLTKEMDDAREGEQEEIATAAVAWSQAEKDAAALHVACHDRDEWKARATTAEAALADLIALTGQTDAAKAVAVVATMLAGADHGSYGSVVREYAECKAERDRMREALVRTSECMEAHANYWRRAIYPTDFRPLRDQLFDTISTVRAALQPQEATDGPA